MRANGAKYRGSDETIFVMQSQRRNVFMQNAKWAAEGPEIRKWQLSVKCGPALILMELYRSSC